MVPEFKQIIAHPANLPLPSNSRKLSTPHQGIHASENGCSSHSPSGLDTEHTITVGVHHTPEEFVKQALAIGHPTRFHSFFPDEMNEVVQYCAHSTPGDLARERTEEIKRWIHLSSSLSEAERHLKENMSSRRKQVLHGKNLLLFKTLMEDAMHRDSDLVDQLASGFDLTGGLPESQVFARKMRPAAMSRVELRRISGLCRQNMLQTVVSSGDPKLDSQLYAATMKEVSKGFLIGPIEPADLPEGSTLTRRFGVKQKSKTRPIDDYKASFVNSSVSQTETATVHTVDHIASLVACIMRASDELGTSESLSAKTWDLADAYKQIPLSDHAFDNDGFLAVYNPSEKRAEIFQQKVLPFGSVASVTAFLRVAHGIWKVGARLLRLMWTSYFDDFLSVTTSETSRHTDLIISSLFSILGWKLSEDKLIDYHTMCKVLGVEFDLRMSGQGLAAVANTQDRVKELCEELDSILLSGSLRRAEGERLRGRLQFASGQLFGRSARNRMRTLSKHISCGRAALCDDTLLALCELREQISLNIPRLISVKMSDRVHIYVDASYDPEGCSGVGGVLYDSAGQTCFFFSQELSCDFLFSVKKAEQKNMIQELEMLALLIAAELWLPVAEGKRVVIFSDSESVRGSFLKSWSQNDASSQLLKKIFSLEEKSCCQIWLERVPSQSNPSDQLSRSFVTMWNGMTSTRVDPSRTWEQAAFP